MKYVLIVTAVLALAACKDELPITESDSGRTYKAECIDGVEYWIHTRGGYMAVRVDQKTMSFVRCEGNQ